MPVRVGVAPTKTLTKVAIYQIKKKNIATRVVQLITSKEIAEALSLTPVGEVWGVGRRLNQHLQRMGILTALDLAQCDPVYICLLYTSPSPRDGLLSRMPSSA